MDVTSSSVKLAITLESPRGPIQSGPETRLSSLFTGYESGKKQCIGKDSVELVGVKPSCIESITSFSLGLAILHPNIFSNWLAFSTDFLTFTDNLR